MFVLETGSEKWQSLACAYLVMVLLFRTNSSDVVAWTVFQIAMSTHSVMYPLCGSCHIVKQHPSCQSKGEAVIKDVTVVV